MKRGSHLSDETKAKLRAYNTGKKLKPETRTKISIALTGRKNPMYGKHCSEETVQKIKDSLRGKSHPQTEETRKKIGIGNKGRVRSNELRASLAEKQVENWRNLKYRSKQSEALALSWTSERREQRSEDTKRLWHDKEYRKKTISASAASHRTPEFRQKISKNMLARWQDEEFSKRMLENRTRKPNILEMKFNVLLQQNSQNRLKYVGDWSFWIPLSEYYRTILCKQALNPDWISTNGEKKLIELWGDYWHQSDNPQDYINAYSEVGWDCLIIWEHELKDKKAIINKIATWLTATKCDAGETALVTVEGLY